MILISLSLKTWNNHVQAYVIILSESSLKRRKRRLKIIIIGLVLLDRILLVVW